MFGELDKIPSSPSSSEFHDSPATAKKFSHLSDDISPGSLKFNSSSSLYTSNELLGAPLIFGNNSKEYSATQFLSAFNRCIKLNPEFLSNLEFRLAYFGSKLGGIPQDWFSFLEERHDPILDSWTDLCTAFIKEFSVFRSQWQIRIEMHSIRQGSRSIVEYTNHFRSLSIKLPGYGDEALSTHYFIGLNSKFQNYLNSLVSVPYILSDLIELCIDYGGRSSIFQSSLSN